MRSSRWTALATALAMAGAAAACGRDVRPYDGPHLRLAVDGRVNDNVSASARGNMVAVSWSGTVRDTTDVYVAVSVDGGRSFGAPRQVNTVPGDARVSGEQPPRAVLIPDPDGFPQALVVWTRKDPAGTRIAWSYTKDGTTFSPAALVPGADGAGNRGWESIARSDSDRVFALWLDHRETANAAVAPMHRHEAGAAPMEMKVTDAPTADPVARAGLSRLWFSSVDGVIPARAIASGVCYCCKTALAAAGNRVVAAWRHVYPGNQRDIAFTESTDGGRTFRAPVRVSEDHWKFDGCPENGPAIAIDPAGATHVAWVTPRDGVDGAPLALYVASTADGATFSPRAEVRTAGAVAHVQLVAERSGGLVLAWDEATPAGRVVRVARGSAAGNGAVFRTPLTMPGTGDHPALAASDSGTTLAWVRRDAAPSVIGVIRVP
ncbi:MAG TPA: hypothetical protein VG916_01980 [Gemmatimonadaceae bacterium]|nr:hypothetical protein [Gemmatimonadaceae bacterium]